MQKKTVFTVLIVFMLLVGTFSVSLAKDAAEAKIWFKNATGSPLELSLTDSAGNVSYYSLGTNVTQEMLVPGTYAFFASASCGNISGSWNLQPNQTYVVDCEEGGAVAFKISKDVCLDHGWYVHDDGGYWFPSWTTWGKYIYDNPYHFLYDISDGMIYIYSYEWGCWDGDPMYYYGW